MPAVIRPLRLTTALFTAALIGLPALTHAERADRDAPMNIEADALRYDEARQTSVFTGRVAVTKGTIRIRGERLEVRQDAQGNQFGTVIGSASQRAFYRQKRDGLDEYIEGEAERIDYDGQADRVTFRGQAELRRYRGTTLSDRASGAVIVYDNRAQTFSVDGGRAGAGAGDSSGRVRALLTPTKADPGTTQPVPDLPPPALAPSDRLERRP